MLRKSKNCVNPDITRTFAVHKVLPFHNPVINQTLSQSSHNLNTHYYQVRVSPPPWHRARARLSAGAAPAWQRALLSADAAVRISLSAGEPAESLVCRAGRLPSQTEMRTWAEAKYSAEPD